MPKSKLDAELFVMCDFALVSKEGKLSIVGIFDRMFVTDLPSSFLRFFIVATVKGEPGIEHKIKVKAESPSGKDFFASNEISVTLGNNGRTHHITDVANFPLPETGEYKLKLLSQNKQLAKITFSVTKVQDQNGNKEKSLN